MGLPWVHHADPRITLGPTMGRSRIAYGSPTTGLSWFVSSAGPWEAHGYPRGLSWVSCADPWVSHGVSDRSGP